MAAPILEATNWRGVVTFNERQFTACHFCLMKKVLHDKDDPCRDCQEAAGLGDRSDPIQSDTVANQISALSVVHNSFQDQELRGMKRKLADTTLEMERARMATEDARGAMVSSYSSNHHTTDPRHRRLSWREFAVERNSVCDHLVFNVIEPATDILAGVRAQISGALATPCCQGDGRMRGALGMARQAMDEA